MVNIVEGLYSLLEKIRSQKPLIVNMTNDVVMNFVANGLLTLGASPVMSHEIEDLKKLVAFSGAFALNTGTPDNGFVETAIMTAKTANGNNVPVVLDPVGAGATPYRKEINKIILDSVDVNVLRGNASEIIAFKNTEKTGKGVDSLHTSDEAVKLAEEIALEKRLVVCVSGETDFITNGKKNARISGGDKLLTRVTGMGCLLTALTAAFCAVSDDNFFAGIASHVLMAICAEKALKISDKPGSFSVSFLDMLYCVDEKDFKKYAKIEINI